MFHVKHKYQDIVFYHVKQFCNKMKKLFKNVYQHYQHYPHPQYFEKSGVKNGPSGKLYIDKEVQKCYNVLALNIGF